jgi:hypothetical protein
MDNRMKAIRVNGINEENVILTEENEMLKEKIKELNDMILMLNNTIARLQNGAYGTITYPNQYDTILTTGNTTGTHLNLSSSTSTLQSTNASGFTVTAGDTVFINSDGAVVTSDGNILGYSMGSR